MEKKRNCAWFLEPFGSHSNEILAKGLDDMGEENTLKEVDCQVNGKKERHSLFKCTWNFVSKAQKSRETDSNLSFKIWCKEGGGAIKPWKFDHYSRPGVARISRQLKEMYGHQVCHQV